MMAMRLPYRIQIPLGLVMAVIVAVVLVTGVAARVSARSAREETLSTVDRAVALLSAQARPLLASDDTWQVFALLRNTAALIPGASTGHARVAVLDAQGRVFAASIPSLLPTGQQLLGTKEPGLTLPPASRMTGRTVRDESGHAFVLAEPIRSEDGQTLGFVYVEIDRRVFAPQWAEITKPALGGAILAVVLLVPLGWWIGHRMTQPIARIASVIERMGRDDLATLRQDVPRPRDRELARISDAVALWIDETRERRQAERRALSAERMAAVGRMTAAVAHEINNPLAGLMTAARTLQMHGGAEATRIRTIELLQRGLGQIQTTVAALLPQARVEDRPLAVTDIDDVVTLAEPAAVRLGVALSYQTHVDSALRAPSAALRQVMLNLLLNAIKAAGGQGEVSLALSADEDVVRVEVANTGRHLTGIALQERIAAESGDDPRGFGLWVCHELATQFAGGFHADESFQSGTCLVFWIPNRERHEEAAPH